jgi:hypothetical protein
MGLGFGRCYCRRPSPTGWYWAEFMRDRLVLYSYYAQSHGLLKLGP